MLPEMNNNIFPHNLDPKDYVAYAPMFKNKILSVWRSLIRFDSK